MQAQRGVIENPDANVADAGNGRRGDGAVGNPRPGRHAHEHAALGQVDGVAFHAARGACQGDIQLARQTIMAAAVAEFGLPQEDDATGLQLLGQLRDSFARLIDPGAVIDGF